MLYRGLCDCSQAMIINFHTISLLHIVHSTQYKGRYKGQGIKAERVSWKYSTCAGWACLQSSSSQRVAWARCLSASSERVLPERVSWERCLNASSERVLPQHVAWARLLSVCCLSVLPESNRVLTWVYIPLFLTQMALHMPVSSVKSHF